MKRDVIYIIAIVLLSLLLNRQCSISPEIVEVTRTDTVFDTIEKQVPIEKIKPIYITTLKHDTVYKYAVNIEEVEVDTSYAIDEFYSTSIYSRVLKDDSAAYISLIDTIKNNELQKALLTYQNRQSQKIVKISEFKRAFYLGGTISLNKTNITPVVMYRHNKTIYGYGYDVANKNHQLGLFYQIKGI